MALVYLLHSDTPLGNARKSAIHYLGKAKRLKDRLIRHGGGNPATSSHITAAFVQAGATLTVARVWECGKDEKAAYLLEKSLKARKEAKVFCPMCKGEHPMPVRGKVLSVRFDPAQGAVLTERKAEKVDRRRKRAA